MIRTRLFLFLISILLLGGCAQTKEQPKSTTIKKESEIQSANVKKWLEHTLVSHSNIQGNLTITQEGHIYTRDKWLPFRSTTTYSDTLSYYQWDANIKVAFGVWVDAEDGHNKDEGWGGARMWKIIPLGSMRGEKVHSMQVSRSLAEIAWKPELVRTSENISWVDTGPNTFSATKHLEKESVTVNFELNDDYQITRAWGLRYLIDEDELRKAQWDYMFSNHSLLNGVKIPLKAVATYHKDDGPWEYLRVDIISN